MVSQLKRLSVSNLKIKLLAFPAQKNVLEAETNAESWICLFCSAPCRRVIFGIPYTLSSAIFCPRFIDALPQLMTRVPSSVLLQNSHSGPGLNIYHHGQQSLSSLGPGRRFQLSFPSSGVSLGPAWQEVPVDFSLFWEQTFPWKIRFIKYLPRSSIYGEQQFRPGLEPAQIGFQL